MECVTKNSLFKLFVPTGYIPHDSGYTDYLHRLDNISAASIYGNKRIVGEYYAIQVPSYNIVGTSKYKKDLEVQYLLPVDTTVHPSTEELNIEERTMWTDGSVLQFPISVMPQIDKYFGYIPNGLSLFRRVLVPCIPLFSEEPRENVWVYSPRYETLELEEEKFEIIG